MRWIWIDRFIEFESGRYATAVKQVTLAEEHLHDHCPAYPMMPNTLVMEGLAQTAGLLVFEHSRYTKNPIMAKIPSVRFLGDALPGDTLIYSATVKCVEKDGALVSATSRNGDQLQAEAEIVFAHFDGEHRKGMLFDPKVFLDLMHLLGAFEVGHAADGSRLTGPPVHVEAFVLAGAMQPAENGRSPSDYRAVSR